MIKLFATSFYNTLIDEEDAIPTSTMLEFERIRKKNIKLVILTNRLEEEVLYYNQDYPFIDYIISLNGSRILNVEKKKAKELRSFQLKEIKEIEKQFAKNEILYYTKDKVYSFLPEDTVYKIEIKNIKKTPKMDYCVSILERNKEFFLEITKNNFYDALRRLGSEKDFLLVIGNESEDILLDKYDNIYVVSNAPKRLKSKSNNKTKSNQKKGVEEVIINNIK